MCGEAGVSHETGFSKGFPRCVYQEETTNLHLEVGPGLLSIHVSITEMIEGDVVDRNIFWKVVAITRACNVVCSSLKVSFVVWE